MNNDRLQAQRFELKYRISEATAAAVRHFVRGRLAPDEYGATPEVPSYPVHSLYLDSGDLALCQATINGDRNRFKLRARYYDDRPEAPICFEIKRRVDRCILKQRALVRREFAPALLLGEPPAPHHLAKNDVRHYTALQLFHRLLGRLQARPKAHVAYEREAWISTENNSVRVTFDRHVRCEPVTTPHLATAFGRAAEVFAGTVVLELKFTDRFPHWMSEMVRGLDLTQANAAKYVDGILLAGATRGPLTELWRRRSEDSGTTRSFRVPLPAMAGHSGI